MKRIILHIDMDAFFAAVEQRDNPELIGKPVIIGADPKQGRGRGVVSTCSYEARKFGVHSAMPISQAFKRCPNGVYLRGRMHVYSDISRQLMDILYDFTPLVEPISIDEAFLDISGSIRLFGEPPEIASLIKQRLRNDINLTASIGIAPNKFIAKIASDLKKPDGIVIVNNDDVLKFLRPLPISKMWGVGKKSEPHLQKCGIKTIGDLAKLSEKQAADLLGKNSLRFWHLANGRDERDVVTWGGAKSVSQERTFMEDSDNSDELQNTIYYLCNEVSRLMRKSNQKGRTVTLKIRFSDFSTFTRASTSHKFLQHSQDLYDIAIKLFNSFSLTNKKVRLLGVGVSNLNTIHGEQLTIFDQEESQSAKLDHVMDLVEKKFGHKAIRKASLMHRHSYRQISPSNKSGRDDHPHD